MKMEQTVLGRTGLKVSVMALGCGGPSRLGQMQGRSPQESARVVREAIDLGVTFMDTAKVYGTEEIVAAGLAEVPRDRVVISTKIQPFEDGALLSADQLTRALEESLRRLRTDYVDVYHLHGVIPDHYEYARDELVPRLRRLREAGKLRWMGITERYTDDSGHRTLSRAVTDGWPDVVMVGFNMINQSARDTVLPVATKNRIGVMVMVPVSRPLSNPDRLKQVVEQLVKNGEIDPQEARESGTLEFLLHPGGATSIPDAAYRYCRHEPGCDVIISGTGNVDHLRQNVLSLQGSPLPAADVARINRLFARARTPLHELGGQR